MAGANKANDLIIKSHGFSLAQELSWSSQIRDTLAGIGLLESFINVNPTSHTRAFQRKVDIFHQNAFAELKEESSKLRTYGIIKQNQGIEKYLLADIKPDHRLAMTKLRLSNHDLMIEKGRHQKIDKNFQFCPFCATHIV